MLNGLEQLIEDFPIRNRFDAVWEKISREKMRESATSARVKISVAEADDAPTKLSLSAKTMSKEINPPKK